MPSTPNFAGLFGMPEVHLQPVPEILAGRYRVQEKLGEGSLCEVYAVWDEQFEAERAAKILRTSLRRNERAHGRMMNEARSLAKLRHPNIVSLSDLDDDPVVGPVLIMRRVRGITLKKRIAQRGALELGEALQIARSICDALVEAHSHRVVHRDLKPANVMIDEDGNVCVTDFGIARVSLHHVSVTRSDATLGTVYYMAPEQRANPKLAGTPADIYSLGVLVHRLLFPTRRIDLAVTTLQPHSRAWMEIPRLAQRLIAMTCKMEPEERPTAEELLAFIDTLL